MPVDGVAALGTDVGEAEGFDDTGDLTGRKGRTAPGSRSAGHLERGEQGSGGHMLLGVLDLVEVQLDRLSEIAQRLRDRAALAGHVDLKALRHVPVSDLRKCAVPLSQSNP